MSITEITLLITGAVVFVLSFLLPVKKNETSKESRALVKEEIQSLVSQEMDNVKEHVDDVVEEAVGYAMEKTERSLERLSNEKIMAVNEYSDTVLEEIHKNHEEVMFLYDMLNDKHINLKKIVTEVNRTVKEVEATKKEAEAVVSTFQRLAPEDAGKSVRETAGDLETNVVEPDNRSKDLLYTQGADDKLQDGMDTSFVFQPEEEGRNNNEKILELYRKGKSKVAIAKELGLGVGEVKLVIDLYKNL